MKPPSARPRPTAEAASTAAVATDGIPLIDRESLDLRAALERRHWWFRGRDAVLEAVLRRFAPTVPGAILEAGCGTGIRAQRLAKLGRVTAIDVNPAAVVAARERGLDACEASVESLPFADGSFGLITCLDVIEHVADDRAGLAELRRVSRPGATMVLTAPAYPRLFGAHDVAAGHRRRYTRGRLGERTRATGWATVFATNFNALLLPAAVAARIAARRRDAAEPRSDLLRTPGWADRALVAPLRAEAAAIGRAVALPVGLSLLYVLRAE